MAKLIVALDLPHPPAIWQLVENLAELVEYYKVGPVPFTVGGVSLVEQLRRKGKRVFLDLKFFDIPHVVGETVQRLCQSGVDLITVHLLGGRRMAEAALEAKIKSGSPAALLGVTVLTSMTEDDWRPLGVKTDLKQMVKNLACLGREWGLDGVVCSPEEAGFLRNLCPSPFLLVCPGIRWSAATDDQKRVASPGLAAAQGADFLVVGRPVYQAPDPVRIVTEILKEIQRGEKGLA